MINEFPRADKPAQSYSASALAPAASRASRAVAEPRPRAKAMLKRADRLFSESGVPAYLVGGAVRDAMMGRSALDFDVAIAASPHALAPEIAAEIGGKFVSLDSERDVARVITGADGGADGESAWLDLSAFADGIESDLALRDFTVNAMAVELSSALSGDWRRVRDPFGGARDLRDGVIRAARDSAFESDPIRLLRAVRLSAETGLAIDESTQSLMRRDAALLSRSSPERVREELLRTLAAPRAGRWIRMADALELLAVVFPELDEARGVAQPKEHYYDVFGHLLAAVDFADEIIRDDYASPLAARETPRFDGMDAYFAQPLSDAHSRGTFLKLAALLHDVAKPRTKTVEPSGRVRFFGHSEVGEDMAAAAARRLRMGGRAVRHLRAMVRHHLRPRQMSNGDGLPTSRAVHRYYRDLGDVALDTLYLNMADFLAARGPLLAPPEMERQARTISHILRVGPQKLEARTRKMSGLLTGHDIMNEFRLRPGPIVGGLLRAVAEAEASGEVGSREEALSLAKTHLRTGGSAGG